MEFTFVYFFLFILFLFLGSRILFVQPTFSPPSVISGLDSSPDTFLPLSRKKLKLKNQHERCMAERHLYQFITFNTLSCPQQSLKIEKWVSTNLQGSNKNHWIEFQENNIWTMLRTIKGHVDLNSVYYLVTQHHLPIVSLIAYLSIHSLQRIIQKNMIEINIMLRKKSMIEIHLFKQSEQLKVRSFVNDRSESDSDSEKEK